MPDFSKAAERLLIVTAVSTGQSVTLTIGTTTGIKAAMVGSSSGLEYGEYDTDTARISYMVPWGRTLALPSVGLPVVVTSGQHSGEAFQIDRVAVDSRASAAHIVIECVGVNE